MCIQPKEINMTERQEGFYHVGIYNDLCPDGYFWTIAKYVNGLWYLPGRYDSLKTEEFAHIGGMIGEPKFEDDSQQKVYTVVEFDWGDEGEIVYSGLDKTRAFEFYNKIPYTSFGGFASKVLRCLYVWENGIKVSEEYQSIKKVTPNG